MPRIKDLTGHRYGRWLVLKFSHVGPPPKAHAFWRCLCDCGVVKTINNKVLRGDQSQSCGCLQREIAENGAIHGESRRTGPTPEYRALKQLMQRCTNQNNPAWEHYGGRGIKVCERWQQSFQAFLADVGRRPSPAHSLDRKEVNGNYEPGNVRWATRAEQNKNRRKIGRIETFSDDEILSELKRRGYTLTMEEKDGNLYT